MEAQALGAQKALPLQGDVGFPEESLTTEHRERGHVLASEKFEIGVLAYDLTSLQFFRYFLSVTRWPPGLETCFLCSCLRKIIKGFIY